MKRALMLTTAILACSVAAAPAFAQDTEDAVVNNEVINGQLNLGAVWAGMDVHVSDVSGDVNGTAAAIGNSFSASLGNHSQVENFQRTTNTIGSQVNATLADVEGDVNLTSAAVGNTASIHSHGNIPCPNDPQDCPELNAELELTNTQLVGTVDPYAGLNISASGVGNVNGTAAAIGNSLSVEMGGIGNSITSWQAINGPTGSSVNATISNAEGVNLTSAAVANTVSIDNLMD